MVKIVEYRDIPLDDLTIGQAQARVTSAAQDIDELAKSIEVQGLLQPIVVCEARAQGKWEILTGQRRFLAHRKLNKEKIAAAVLDSRVNESHAKAISITENLMRRKLTSKELKDGILYLYNIYESVTDVVRMTGLPKTHVQDYVKYPRLIPELKTLVDEATVDINAAVKAQDASEDNSGNVVPEVAVRIANDMGPMSGVQRKNVLKERKNNPDKPIDDVIENAKSGAHVIQVIATVSRSTHQGIQEYALAEKMNQDEAVAGLIEEGLTTLGFLE